MSGIIRVDMPKGVEEGQTSLTPASPTRSNVSSPRISRKGAVMIGYGVQAARQTYTTVVSEISAGGNEQLATQIQNAATLLGTIGGAIATGGATLIPQAISGVASQFTQSQANQRENKNRIFESKIKGSLNNYLNGGGG